MAVEARCRGESGRECDGWCDDFGGAQDFVELKMESTRVDDQVRIHDVEPLVRTPNRRFILRMVPIVAVANL